MHIWPDGASLAALGCARCRRAAGPRPQGLWRLPFAPEDTRPAGFAADDGSRMSVAMMRLSAADVELLALPDCYSAVRLPIQAGRPLTMSRCPEAIQVAW